MKSPTEMSLLVLDEQNFHQCCQHLLQQSQQLDDGWSWEAVQVSEGYLKKTALRSVTVDWSPVWDLEGLNSESEPDTSAQQGQEKSDLDVHDDADNIKGDIDDEEEDNGAYTDCQASSRVLQYEYHILYSCSYSTPVLYFRASTLEGRILSLEEVWSFVHPNFRPRLQKSPLNTITMQEHPLLGQPFFMLHPCKTEEFMRPILQMAQDQNSPVNYVLSWLTVVGPVVGLDVPLKYSTQLQLATEHSSTEPD